MRLTLEYEVHSLVTWTHEHTRNWWLQRDTLGDFNELCRLVKAYHTLEMTSTREVGDYNAGDDRRDTRGSCNAQKNWFHEKIVSWTYGVGCEVTW